MDIRTMLIVLIFVNFFLFCIMFAFQKLQKTYPGFIFWALSYFFGFLLCVFLILRNMMPQFYTIILVNIAAVLVGVLRLLGVRVFFRKKASNILFLLLPVSYIVFYYFTNRLDSLIVRNCFLSIILASLSFYTGIFLLFVKEHMKINYITASIFFIHSIAVFLRGFPWKLFPETINLFYVDLFNYVYFLIIIILDITWAAMFLILNNARLSIELQDKNFKLKELNEIKDKFMTTIVHDLNTPCYGIITLAEMIEHKVKTIEDQDLNENVKLIKDSALRAHNLMKNLLKWSMNKNEFKIVKPDFHSLIDLIEMNIKLLKNITYLKKMNIHVDILEDIKIYADFEMSKSIIRNILVNAIKFSKQNSKIDLTVEKKIGSVVLKIKDYGKGIAGDELKNIFNYKKDLMAKSDENGLSTGLGLLLVKDYINRNNGKVWVESELGIGTEFFIEFKTVKFEE